MPRTTINTQMSLPPIITTINTQMPLPTIITTINTRLLPTPSLPSLPTLTPTPVSVSTPSQIPVPILTPLKKSKRRSSLNIKKPSSKVSYDDNIKLEDTKKPSSKVCYDDNNGDIDDDSLYNYEFSNPGPGTRTAIIAIENDIKNSYDNINYLQKKLLNAKNYDERNKILNNIEQAKKNIPKKEKELNNLKMGLVKKKKNNKDKKKNQQKKLEPMKQDLFQMKLWNHCILPNEERLV